MMKRKRFLIIIALFIVILGAFGYYWYRISLPKIVAKAVVKKDYPAFTPTKYKTKINKISEDVNDNLETIIVKSSEAGVSMDDLLQAIDEVEEDEVRKVVDILENTNISDTEKVFDIAVNNIHIQSFNLEVFRETFISHIKTKHIKKTLKYIKTHNLLEEMDPDMGRAIAKQLLLQKESEIRQKVELTK